MRKHRRPAAAALLCAPALLAVLLPLAGCSAAPSHASPLPAPGEPDEEHPRRGPERPKAGKWYPYDLFTHCGVETARFAGRWWTVSAVRTDIDPEVAGDPVEWGFNHTPGYMQLESDGVAVFRTAGQPPVAFRPTGRPSSCH